MKNRYIIISFLSMLLFGCSSKYSYDGQSIKQKELQAIFDLHEQNIIEGKSINNENYYFRKVSEECDTVKSSIFCDKIKEGTHEDIYQRQSGYPIFVKSLGIDHYQTYQKPEMMNIFKPIEMTDSLFHSALDGFIVQLESGELKMKDYKTYFKELKLDIQGQYFPAYEKYQKEEDFLPEVIDLLQNGFVNQVWKSETQTIRGATYLSIVQHTGGSKIIPVYNKAVLILK